MKKILLTAILCTTCFMQNHINASNISVMTEDECLKFFQEQLNNPVNPYFKKDKLKKIETFTISINDIVKYIEKAEQAVKNNPSLLHIYHAPYVKSLFGIENSGKNFSPKNMSDKEKMQLYDSLCNYSNVYLENWANNSWDKDIYLGILLKILIDIPCQKRNMKNPMIRMLGGNPSSLRGDNFGKLIRNRHIGDFISRQNQDTKRYFLFFESYSTKKGITLGIYEKNKNNSKN